MRAPGPGRTPRRVIRVPGISCALARSVITHLPSCIHPEGAQNSWNAYYSVLSRSSTPRTRPSPKSRPPELVEPDIAGQGRDRPSPCAGLPEVAGRVPGVLWKSAATARAIPRDANSCGLPGRFPADRRAQPRRGGRAVLPGPSPSPQGRGAPTSTSRPMPRTMRAPPPRVHPRRSNEISGATTRGDSSGSRLFSGTQSQRGRSPAPGTAKPSPRSTDRASARRPVLRAPSMTDTRRLAAHRCLPLPGRHQHLSLVLRLRAQPLTPAVDQH
jgi:hypothetical protein